MPPPPEHILISKDLLVLQLGQVDLLLAMYETDGAISIDESTKLLLDELRAWCDSDVDQKPSVAQHDISLLLSLEVETAEALEKNMTALQVSISVPIAGIVEEEREDPPKVKVRVLQPQWMSKAEASSLFETLPDDDLLSIIEHIRDMTTDYITNSQASVTTTMPSSPTSSSSSIIRVWFYFPSISTRSKRDDLINNAPRYDLTGFLLAGKPGILCLEGRRSRDIDDFMRFIKTESWGDIPPQHKKVTERFREEVEGRVFQGMKEITGEIGRRGERANRNDMKVLEDWLKEMGVGAAFGKVLISG